MKPFANESEVLEIGALTIENRLDRISLYGSLDITLDRAGQANAAALHALLGAVLEQMAAQDLPAHLPPPQTGSVDNPFL